ncbi:helicase SWR1 [Schizosaccharomyces japonicus yFS275]|uniref:DNA helicase n=1 Tax=Schizosaccharomyces japonicus (strain yFS275 / FY16936) TaxID=402676 RepID=B6JZA9_SCHJY|nr:helicase SWR1 [Schizosaccharomyces japonicus yFS275]EEB06877.1 helicase SWR1 [Schizosaccharomyces japonicus yFS275]
MLPYNSPYEVTSRKRKLSDENDAVHQQGAPVSYSPNMGQTMGYMSSSPSNMSPGENAGRVPQLQNGQSYSGQPSQQQLYYQQQYQSMLQAQMSGKQASPYEYQQRAGMDRVQMPYGAYNGVSGMSPGPPSMSAAGMQQQAMNSAYMMQYNGQMASAMPSYTRVANSQYGYRQAMPMQQHQQPPPPQQQQQQPTPGAGSLSSLEAHFPESIIKAVQRIRYHVPQASTHLVINVLAQTSWNEVTALSILSQKLLGYDVSSRLQQASQMSANAAQMPAMVYPQYESSKRTVQSQKRSIRDRYMQNQANAAAATGSSAAAQYVPPQTHITLRKSSKRTGEDDDFYDSEEESETEIVRDTSALENTVLHFLNTCSAKELSDTASCPLDHSKILLEHRPFQTLAEACVIKHPDDVPSKPGKRGKRREKQPLGQKIVNTCMETMEGYYAIDSLIARCESLGRRISQGMESWGVSLNNASGEVNLTDVNASNATTDPAEAVNSSGFAKFVTVQPKCMGEGIVLKSYQLVGMNWLNLLYRQNLSGILADEMGLGKTCQVVSFFALLLESGRVGPHLVVVPSSTLENWLRELARFCPSLKVEPYYGNQQERAEIREAIEENEAGYNVLVTTYQLATSSKEDRAFLKRQKFDVCVYDEGHYLKNRMSERYRHLMNINASFRLLLTGTPLQNNLKELVSLLAFILPNMFDNNMEGLDVIFKAKPTADGDIEQALLSKQRISRAKTMMTPFVLRRRKMQVLNDLSPKIQIIENCELSAEQKTIYDRYNNLRTMKKEAKKNGVPLPEDKSKTPPAGHILMQLRKAANHALLFREKYTDKIIRKMAKDIMTEEQYKNANEQYIYEDMEVMSDFELHKLCRNFPSLHPYMLKDDPWMKSGKIDVLKKLLPKMKEQGDRILIFSQFTQVIDILEQVLDTLKITYTRLDGSTQVETRQDIIDQFHRETDITVFLLSTKAGGFGINLACANVVILYDCSYNPFDDLQAEDRAHRVGQTKQVTVIRLITKNTVEEYIQRLANTKLALDMSLSSENKDREMLGEKLVQDMLEADIPQTTVGNEVNEPTTENNETASTLNTDATAANPPPEEENEMTPSEEVNSSNVNADANAHAEDEDASKEESNDNVADEKNSSAESIPKEETEAHTEVSQEATPDARTTDDDKTAVNDLTTSSAQQQLEKEGLSIPDKQEPEPKKDANESTDASPTLKETSNVENSDKESVIQQSPTTTADSLPTPAESEQPAQP